MLAWDPTHPLVERLDGLTLATSATERLGLDPDADPTTVAAAANDAWLTCRRQRSLAIAAAEREAWTVLERSYQLLAQQPR